MTPSFHDLCANFCAAAQVPTPDLHEQEDGMQAFTVFWRDVAIDFMANPSVAPGHALLVFHLGTPDPAHGDFPRILQALLYTNFIGMGLNQPVFSCHPDTQGVMLQWAVTLDGLTGDALHQLVEQGVDLARQWRQTHFLPATGAGPDATRGLAAARFA